MWDVAVERQIQVKGPDAAALVDLLITRDVHSVLPTMTARYVILCNQYGGVITTRWLLRVADDEFWFSISDSDVALWAQGVNANAGYNVEINEIDVAPVQIQGPKSVMLMEKMFGPQREGYPVLPHHPRHAERPCSDRFPVRASLLRSASRYTCTTPCSTRTTSGRTSWSRAKSST